MSPPLNSEFNRVTWGGPRDNIHDSGRDLKDHVGALPAPWHRCHHCENVCGPAFLTKRDREKRAELPQSPQSKPARSSQSQSATAGEPSWAQSSFPGESGRAAQSARLADS